MRTAVSPTANHFLFVPPRLRKIAPYFILVLAIVAAYGNVYDNAFLYDDESLILKNAFLRDWHYLGAIFSSSITAGANIAGGFYRPLQIALYFLIFQAAGLSTFAFHLLNIVLHAANACLVYRLGRKLRFNPTAVFCAALIWALHPVQVEAVTYMSATADPLFAFFMLLGIILIVPRFRPEQILASIPVFILGLLSKEEAVIFPLLAASCIFLLERERFKAQAYKRLWPLAAVAVLYVLAHALFLNFGGFALYRQHDIYAASVLCRIYTFLATLPHYLGFLIWPVHLHFDRDFQPVTSPWNLPTMTGIGMVGIAAAQIMLGRNRRALALSWGLLWFAAAHVLHTGVLEPVNSVLLEHWMYLPSAGLFLGTAQSLASVKWQRKQRKPFETGVLVVASLVLGVMTYAQNRIWRDPESFYLNIFQNGEPSPHAHNNLGITYALEGRYGAALDQFDMAIKYSGDTNPQAQHDLAITLLNGPNGKEFTQDAIRHLKRALEIDPDYYPSSLALAALYDETGNKKEAGRYRAMSEASRRKLIGP